jgi:lysylphosphatidylglycerol synthetase-like protein (DUF2156 family)
MAENKDKANYTEKRRLFEDISLGAYVFIVLGVIPYLDSSSNYLSMNFWMLSLHFICVFTVIVLLILGVRLSERFGHYWLWGWRETIAVIFLCFYVCAGWIGRPRGVFLKESTWLVCIFIQGLVLACAQYLEAWFHGKQGHQGSIESRRLANSACWHIFAACWTALAAAIVVAGIVISFGGSLKLTDKFEGQNDIINVILYLILTVVGVFLWLVRPCFQKSARIISELVSEMKGGHESTNSIIK